MAPSREAWALAHASKTNSPDVGKYKPKYTHIEKVAPITQIIAEGRNKGSERIMARDIQHTVWCDKVLNCLNDHSKHNHSKRKLSENMSTKQLDAVDDYDGDKAANGENLLSLKILGGDDGRL